MRTSSPATDALDQVTAEGHSGALAGRPAFTGNREMSGKAMVAYVAPLKTWLDQQNKGKLTGW